MKNKPPVRKELTIEGKTVTEIVHMTSLSRMSVNYRIRKGWSLEKIINTPARETYDPRVQKAPNPNLLPPIDPLDQRIASQLKPAARAFCGLVHCT